MVDVMTFNIMTMVSEVGAADRYDASLIEMLNFVYL